MIILFTRHKLTDVQRAEIEATLRAGEEVIDMTELAARNIMSMDEAGEIADLLVAEARRAPWHTPVRLFGVLPAPIRAALCRREEPVCEVDVAPKLSIFEAFNVSRSPEGGAPTFEHVCWLHTQTFSF